MAHYMNAFNTSVDSIIPFIDSRGVVHITRPSSELKAFNSPSVEMLIKLVFVFFFILQRILVKLVA